MKRRVRVSLAAVGLALSALAPATAQETTTPASSSEEVVGPPQLRDFSLNGMVTRPAEAPPPRNQPAPTETARAPRPAAPAPVTTVENRAPTPRSQASREARAETQPPQQRNAPAQTTGTVGFDLAPPTPARDPPPAFASATVAPQPAASPDVGSFAPAADDSGGDWTSRLPWLIALLAAAGAAFWYFRRQRSGYALAGAGANTSAFDAGPQAAPVPRAPAQPLPPRPQPPQAGEVQRPPVPAAAPPAVAPPKGIVSVRLRPWLDIEFAPERAVFDGERATVEFGVVILNTGSAPARDVFVEAALFNAGPDQDQAIGAFFSNPVGKGTPVSVIDPLQPMAFKSSVTLGREQMRIFNVEGRALFVPVIGFNVMYRWSAGKGQTSASYLIGRDTNGEKMAPFRTDQGPRTFAGLGAREHTLRIRN